MAEFAGYGFAKSHSTAYALITYQTAYLKANHPREYMAALLTTEAGNHDKLARYIAHAQQRGIDILAPSVNESERDFTVVREGVRFGLAGVKNVGEGAIEAILEARASGPFRSLFDFASRIDGRRVNRRVVESLVKCGAFDALHAERAEVWASLDVALEAGAAAQRDREIGQANLFGGAGRRRARARAGRRGAVDRPAAARVREGGARLLRHRATRSRRSRRSSRASPTRARTTPRAARAATCARAGSSPRCARRARGADR